jgi:N-acetylglucosaminyl-diphospho-decaprenol L-rhamnosyltransferase
VTVDVSVIVVAYEARDLLLRCLAALDADARTATSNRELIVVDNASTDGTADALRAQRPDVKLVALDRNLGFGAGNNRGLAEASGRFVFLLNSDAFVDVGCIDELVRFCGAHARCGAVGPRLRFEDGRLQRSCRGYPSVYRLATEYLFLRKLAPRSTLLNAFYCGGFDHDLPRRVDWLTGAAVLLRREALDAAGGGFDEAFFLYSEEVDLLRRVGDAGWETWFDPSAGAVHVWGGSTRRDPGPTFREQLRSHLRYLHKHEGPAAARRGRVVLLAGLRLRGLRSAAFREHARWLAERDVDALLAGR